MFSPLAKAIDRLVIRCASSPPSPQSEDAHAAEAQELLAAPDFYCGFVEAPVDLRFSTKRAFSFRSPLPSRWDENNTVQGRLYRSGRDWRHKPSVVLLHGWNGELGYRWQFPWLAWRLTRAGVNAAMIELPYHAQRKPHAPGAVQNFISYDLRGMIEATRQALGDTRALLAWLQAQGSACTGVWGISLGAWLAGLLMRNDPHIRFAVLMTPIARLDRAIQQLAFCAPVRRALEGTNLRLDPLNLETYLPLTDPENILLVESIHDQFAPAETVEELWRAWNRPSIWRLPHGHISVLFSPPVMERVVKWVGQTAAAAVPRLAPTQAQHTDDTRGRAD